MLQKIKQVVKRKLCSRHRIASDPKPTLFVHGGAGKTGTSGIQRFLGEQRERLCEFGLEYPIFNTSVPITTYPWAGNAAFFGRDLNLGKFTQKELDSLAVSIRKDIKSETPKVLFSGESLSNATRENIDKFMMAFGRYFDIDVIFFLRDPLPWYYSAWKQIVRTVNEVRTFEQFLEARKLQPILCPQGWFEHARKVHLFSYDEHKKNLISTFFSAMDIDIKQSFPDVDTVSANPSLNRAEVNFLRLFQSIPAFAADMPICQKIADEFIRRPGREPDGKPDPCLADLAIKNQEPMLAVTDKYLHRSRIIKTVAHDAPRKCEPTDAWIDPEHVRIALEVLAKHYSSKDAS